MYTGFEIGMNKAADYKNGGKGCNNNGCKQANLPLYTGVGPMTPQDQNNQGYAGCNPSGEISMIIGLGMPSR